MKIRQAIDTRSTESKPEPRHLLVMAMHKMHEKFGYEQAQAQVYAVAIRVADECGCYFELIPDTDPSNETFLFWSKSLGNQWPNISEAENIQA